MSEQNINAEIVCKHCGSEGVVKFGTYKGVQRYYCKICKRKFKADNTTFHMKTPANQVASALNMYYEGMSIKAIRRQLQQDYDITPSTATIFEWIIKFTNEAVNDVKDYYPKVGDTWVADETFVRVDKAKTNVENPYSKSRKAKWVVFWDIIDADTRYLLASHIATTRGIKDAQALMEKASKRAGKLPKVVVTDKLKAYIDGIELTFGSDTQHKQGAPFEVENNTNLIERFHGTLKARTKVMRALKNRDTLEKFADGWLVHYNYLRPHLSLNDRTPAKVARIDYPYENWSDIIQRRKPTVKPIKRLPKERTIRPRKQLRITPKMPRISPRVKDLGAGVVQEGRRRHIRLY